STGDDNLVVRAAKLFFEQAKIKSGVSIKLEKKIPHGAGLGGGSSDAAATLRALNQLFDAKLSPEELAKLGATIGSDVPFFLSESAAICKGRGEIVKPTKLNTKLVDSPPGSSTLSGSPVNVARRPPAPLSILLLKPEFGVSSAWAYSRWNDSKEITSISY